MDDVLGYRGASVIVTGAASGMGAAAAQILVDLGARVTALDLRPTAVAVGLTPFLVGDLVKLAIAAAALPLAWRLLAGRGSRGHHGGAYESRPSARKPGAGRCPSWIEGNPAVPVLTGGGS